MVKGRLVSALDFARDPTQPHEAYSYCVEGRWYVVRSGPTYLNIYEATEHDTEGLAWLEAHERGDATPKRRIQ